MERLIIFPTDTVYGIGCGIFDVESMDKIYEIKKRSKDKPLACLCFDEDQIKNIAEVDDQVLKLIRAFLPGALTIILKSKPVVVDKVGYKTIGVRIPNCKEALAILEKMGPMWTTSVNDSGASPLNEYSDIVQKYQNVVDHIYPPTMSSSSTASTVVAVIDGKVEILREGQITRKQIENILNA